MNKKNADLSIKTLKHNVACSSTCIHILNLINLLTLCKTMLFSLKNSCKMKIFSIIRK